MSSEKVFHVRIRHVDDKKIAKDALSSQMYMLPAKPPFNRCYVFNPKDVTDFTVGREYGKHEGTKTVKYFIILMSESLEDLELQKIDSDKRVRNPTRVSVGPAAEPFDSYTVIKKVRSSDKCKEEKNQAKSEKKSVLKCLHKSKKQVNMSQDVSIIKKFDSKRESKSNDNGDDVGSPPAKKHKISEDHTEQVASDTAISISSGDTVIEKNDNDDDDDDGDFTPCEVCAPEVFKLKKQLKGSLGLCAAWNKKYEDLRKQKDSHLKHIKEINDKLTKLPDQIRSKEDECWLQKINSKFIVPLEEDYSEFPVPEGSYYIGNGRTVTGPSLGSCADGDTMRKRVENLCEAFFGEDLEFMSPSGKREKYGHLLPKNIKVDECYYTSMRAVLKIMPWDDLSEKELKKTP